MATSTSETTTPIAGSRSWLEDDRNTSVEAEKEHWKRVKQGSDELLAYYWSNYGKWGMPSLDRIVFIAFYPITAFY